MTCDVWNGLLVSESFGKCLPLEIRRFIQPLVEFRSVAGKGFVVLADDMSGWGLSGWGKTVKTTSRTEPLYGCEIRRGWRDVAHINRRTAVGVQSMLDSRYIDVLNRDIVLKTQ